MMKKKVNKGRACCVPGCSNGECRNPELKFYSFPNRSWEVERKKKWIVAVRRGGIGRAPWEPTKNTRICSVHFLGGEKSNDPRKEAYNPTIYPWRNEIAAALERTTKLQQRAERVSKIDNIENDICEVKNALGAEAISQNPSQERSSEISTQTDYLVESSEVKSIAVLFCWQDSYRNEVSTQTSITL